MPVELDHIFVCVAPGAPEAKDLAQFGLIEGPSNVHPGQGTANRRFFFENAMLELLWVENPGEARNEQTAPTKLWDRWSGRVNGATSPFGIVMQPAQQESMTPPKPDAACPRCGGRAIWIRRKLWDRLSHKRALGKFECDVCNHRFFLRPPRK